MELKSIYSIYNAKNINLTGNITSKGFICDSVGCIGAAGNSSSINYDNATIIRNLNISWIKQNQNYWNGTDINVTKFISGFNSFIGDNESSIQIIKYNSYGRI